MKIFVAGATGAIGRQLLPRLVGAGHQVQAMTRDRSKLDLLRQVGATPILADALNRTEVLSALDAAQPDVVIHELTAIGALDTRHMERDFAATNDLRTIGTANLLEAARAVGVTRVIAQSHILAYSRTGGALKNEGDPFEHSPPPSLRSTIEALRSLEASVLGAAPIEGIVLRYGWFYGPGTSMTSDGTTAALVRKRSFPVVGKGTAIWSFIHVADAAEATVATIDRGSPGIYNIVDDDPAPVSEWLPEIAAELGAKRPLNVPGWLGRLFIGEAGLVMMTELRGATNDKAKRELGWRPAHPSWRGQLSD